VARGAAAAGGAACVDAHRGARLRLSSQACDAARSLRVRRGMGCRVAGRSRSVCGAREGSLKPAPRPLALRHAPADAPATHPPAECARRHKKATLCRGRVAPPATYAVRRRLAHGCAYGPQP
jgi:hypothetical protein